MTSELCVEEGEVVLAVQLALFVFGVFLDFQLELLPGNGTARSILGGRKKKEEKEEKEKKKEKEKEKEKEERKRRKKKEERREERRKKKEVQLQAMNLSVAK